MSKKIRITKETADEKIIIDINDLEKTPINKLSDVLDQLGLKAKDEDILKARKTKNINSYTKFDKVKIIIAKKLEKIVFTSQDVREIYENSKLGFIQLSTISQYLKRLYMKGILDRTGTSAQWDYRIIAGKVKEILSEYNMEEIEVFAETLYP